MVFSPKQHRPSASGSKSRSGADAGKFYQQNSEWVPICWGFGRMPSPSFSGGRTPWQKNQMGLRAGFFGALKPLPE